MHAVYCFLTGKEPLEDFLDSINSGTFRIDENNWYQEMCAVMKNGELRQYCPDEDWRERNWLGKQMEALPQAERWQAALDFTESCVAWEAGQALQMLLGKYSESCTFALDTAVPFFTQHVTEVG